MKKQEKTNTFEIMITIAIFFLMFAILTNPTTYAKNITDGLKLFVTAVLPGLLPFMFLTKVLANLNLTKLTNIFQRPAKSLFGLSGQSLYAFLISILSGYPVGAKITSELYSQKKISDKELLKTSLLCSTSGPIFIIGTVGAFMLNNIKLGVILYFINISSSFISIIIVNLFDKRNKTHIFQSNKKNSINIPPKSQSILNIFTKSASDTMISLLTVAFYIAFFFMFIELLYNFKILQILSNIFNFIFKNQSLSIGSASGLIEMTRGIQLLSPTKSTLSLAIISFLLSFGGFSIIFQSLSFLGETPLKCSKFILGKLFQGVIAFCLSLLIFYFVL